MEWEEGTWGLKTWITRERNKLRWSGGGWV